jgi:O-antigen ligase
LPIAVLIIGSPRRLEWIALVAIVPALIVTRSFATLLSASVALVVLLVTRSAPHPNPLPAYAGRGSFVALIALLGIGLLGRDLGQTVAGRRYLLSVSLPHVTDAPMLGHGLGSTVLAWPTWELSFWKERCADAQCVAADPQSRFAALQDHVHADWVELLLERGLLGFLAFALALAAPLRAAWRNDPFVFAAMAAILTRSLVDFPLHRPAELCLLAALAACADVSPTPTDTSPPS